MSDSPTTPMASAAETKQASPRDLSNLEFNPSDMSDSPTTPLASAAETKQASPLDLSDFDFPALDRSKNQFRLLVLELGDFDDEITATISTQCLPALPPDYNHKPHLTELTAIHDNLSTASSTGVGVQIEEFLRWERLYGELLELYAVTLLHKSLEIFDASGKYRIPYSEESDMGRLLVMRVLFIQGLREYQTRSCEVDAIQGLISRLEGPSAFDPRFHKYTAVSYCCGNQGPQEYITLNDVRVQIPASAERALRGIRSDTGSKTVWIEAICINPSDSKERTHQVLLMSKIYSSAYHTVVRLESAGDVADQLVLDCAVESHRQMTDHPEVSFPTEPIINGSNEISESYRNAAQNLYSSLLVYLNQPWFGRLWVYQEVLLSQSVVVSVGRHLVGWGLIRMAIDYHRCLSPAPEVRDGVYVSGLRVSKPWLARPNGHEHDMGTGFQPRNSEFYLGYTPPSLTSLLLETMPLECLDPHDKVYALLGLTSWSVQRKTLPSELKHDYTLPVSECMRNATLAAIREEMSLDCLTIPIWTKQDPSWPSWVVPWHKLEVGRKRQSHLDIPADYPWIPDCSRGRKVNTRNLRQPDRPDSLILEGETSAKVSEVCNIIDPEDVKGLSFEMKLGAVIRSVVKFLAGRHSQGNLRSLLMMMLWWEVLKPPRHWFAEDTVQDTALQSIGEHVEDLNDSDERTRRDESGSEPEDVKMLKRLIDGLLAEAHATRGHEQSTAASPRTWSAGFSDRLDCFISTSRFYLGQTFETGSSQHIFGCGPKDMEAGDELVGLYGSRLPVVLRPEQSWWLWVGPAFPFVLHGKTSLIVSPSCGGDVEIFEIR